MKDGREEKMMPLFLLHWLHAPSLVSIGKGKLKLLTKTEFPFLVTVTLTLITYSMFGVNRPKQTKVIERKLNFYL